VKPWIRGEDFVWEGTSHLPGFKEEVLRYWAACLTLARKLVKIFALSLDLTEDYFDSRTTYPGADGVFNYYPVSTEEDVANNAVGLGSHTDLQLFTLLWQDMTGGLQVLNREGQWIKATPVEGTIVVNIGDFMMRLCNDIYKSTVHRVYNRSTVERVSMPFFFGEYSTAYLPRYVVSNLLIRKVSTSTASRASCPPAHPPKIRLNTNRSHAEIVRQRPPFLPLPLLPSLHIWFHG
jgi:isopenicillin N synthase-like dioxygenase